MDICNTVGIGIRTSIKRLCENINEKNYKFIEFIVIKDRIWGKQLIFDNDNDNKFNNFLFNHKMINKDLLKEYDYNNRLFLTLLSLKDYEIYDTSFCYQLDLSDMIENNEYKDILDDNDLLITFDNFKCANCKISEFEKQLEISKRKIEEILVENGSVDIVDVVVMNTLRTKSSS